MKQLSKYNVNLRMIMAGCALTFCSALVFIYECKNERYLYIEVATYLLGLVLAMVGVSSGKKSRQTIIILCLDIAFIGIAAGYATLSIALGKCFQF